MPANHRYSVHFPDQYHVSKKNMPENNFAESFKLRCTNDTINFVLISIICLQKKTDPRWKKSHKTVHFNYYRVAHYLVSVTLPLA